jgi:pimeloyl-ACP methyl ester carboxylesterase
LRIVFTAVHRRGCALSPMIATQTTGKDDALKALVRSFRDGQVTRREFMQRAAALGVAGAAASILGSLASNAEAAAAATAAQPPLDVREWSYFWLGIKRAELARGTVAGGQQMYVEYQIPTRLRHAYPIVLVHGGGGQGTDWMGTPDGRPGWFQYLLAEGFAVYVIDRPGHGRPPYHPDLDGPFPPAPTLEFFEGTFTPPQPNTPDPSVYDLKHTQWPGTGGIGSPDLDQFTASQGGAYVQPPAFGPPPPAMRPPPGFLRAFRMSGAEPANKVPPTPPESATALAHSVWRERGAELLDRIGPAIFITHSAGGPFGHLVADSRPDLVKAVVVIEGAVSPFSRGNRWGITTIKMSFDPPASDPGELATLRVTPTEPDTFPYFIQAEPARKLKNLQHIPTLVVTSEASFASPGNPATVAFLKQAGCPAEELRLADVGIHGNGHMMMVEKNNRQVLQPILDWIAKNTAGAGAARDGNGSAGAAATESAGGGSTGFRLGSQGFFWVGTEHKSVPYGTILRGQMYVQYLIPAAVRHPYPVVLVHGGTGQMLHYMGNPGMPGWAHYYLQAGYKVYLVDRPGHGRAPYHPDALGPIGPQPTYELLLGDVRRAANGPHRRWAGSGEIGDPLLDQLMASQNGMPQDYAMQQALWASRGAELLDKIGPAIIQTHSAGGGFGWLAADQRPALVKAIVVFEGAAAPLTPMFPWGVTAAPLAYDPPIASPAELKGRDVPAGNAGEAPYKLQADPARRLKNLQGIPMLYLTAENSGRSGGPGVTAYLRQAGAPAEHLNLKERGILGNGHFAMLESNNKEVFEVIRGWIENKVAAAG